MTTKRIHAGDYVLCRFKIDGKVAKVLAKVIKIESGKAQILFRENDSEYRYATVNINRLEA